MSKNVKFWNFVKLAVVLALAWLVIGVPAADRFIQSSEAPRVTNKSSGLHTPKVIINNNSVGTILSLPLEGISEQDFSKVVFGVSELLSGTDLVKLKQNKFCKAPFAWQDGFGAFSYSKSHVDRVIRYIQNQEAHHKKETFLNEYRKMLKAFEIEYDDRYVFKEAE